MRAMRMGILEQVCLLAQRIDMVLEAKAVSWRNLCSQLGDGSGRCGEWVYIFMDR